MSHNDGNKKEKKMTRDVPVDIPDYEEYEKRMLELWIGEFGRGSPKQREKDFYSEFGQCFVRSGYDKAIKLAKKSGRGVLDRSVLIEAVFARMEQYF